MCKIVSLNVYISENSVCSFQTNIIKKILTRKAGKVLVNVSKSANEFGLFKLKNQQGNCDSENSIG